METTDSFFPLTRRGIETPVYPGRLYSPGGGPKPEESSAQAVLAEVLEETGLGEKVHFDSQNLTMLALVSDANFAGSAHARPELVAYMPVDINFRTVEEIQHLQSIKKGQKQEDVWGVVPITTFIPNLKRAIIYDGFQMCPPTEAGLAHAALYKIQKMSGLEDATNQMKSTLARLQLFERSEYTPPILRLPLSL